MASARSPSDEADGHNVVIEPLKAVHAIVRTGYCYSPIMTLHRQPPGDPDEHPEDPNRIVKIYETLGNAGVLRRMRRVEVRQALKEECLLVHSEAHWNRVLETALHTEEDYIRCNMYYTPLSLYINEHTAVCARYAMGGAIELCRAIADGRIMNGFAIIRPPGHHAEPTDPMGFCLFNNAAVAARWLRVAYQDKGIKKILILDWDVHHGNGTQDAFYQDPDVLYISLHRYDNGSFYPGSTFGGADMVGAEAGKGKSVNIPWEESGLEDSDYIYAFQKLVMPIAYEFAPDFVIISAGFDAAEGDPLGDCKITPAGYAHMTAMLSTLAGGKLAVVLEGGYNVDAIASCALACTQVLLGESPPQIEPVSASSHVTEVVRQVELIQSLHWKCITPQPSELASYDGPQKDIFTPISEILKAHRTYELWKKYKLINVPVDDEELELSFSNQVLCSNDLLSVNSVLLYIHDQGHIHASLTSPTTDMNIEKSYLLDSSSRVIDWARSLNMGIVDVDILPIPHTEHTASAKDRLKRQRAMALFIWDNFVEMAREAKQIVIIGEGAGCNAVAHIINQRATASRVRNKVKAVVQLPHLLQINPITREIPGLRNWYYEISQVICPATHEYMEDERIKARRFGKLFNSNESRPSFVILKAWNDIETFIKGKLNVNVE